MIRYVYIGDQITEGSKEFAFFDTITDRFLTFDGCQVFEGKEELKELLFTTNNPDLLKRCFALIPEEPLP